MDFVIVACFEQVFALMVLYKIVNKNFDFDLGLEFWLTLNY